MYMYMYVHVHMYTAYRGNSLIHVLTSDRVFGTATCLSRCPVYRGVLFIEVSCLSMCPVYRGVLFIPFSRVSEFSSRASTPRTSCIAHASTWDHTHPLRLAPAG